MRRPLKLSPTEKLQYEIKENDTMVEYVKEEITEFMTFLQSDKFHEDTTIQANEVFCFLQRIRMELTK